jgi:hypothetical protein
MNSERRHIIYISGLSLEIQLSKGEVWIP